MEKINPAAPTGYSKPALLIINPVSGKKQIHKYITDIVRKLMDAGYIVTLMITSRRGEATEMVEKYGADYELICCSGGDGTLNEVMNGLAGRGLDIPLGYIPCGSTNDFAIAHSLSTDALTAAENIASGRLRRYDIGRFEDHYFSYVAAFGAFSWLSYTTDQNLKNVLGHTAYIIDGIKDLPKVKPLHVKLTADGTVHEDKYLFGAVCNTTSVAGTFELPASVVDTSDGIFEVLLIKETKTILELEGIVRSLLLQDYTNPYIEFFQAREICAEHAVGMEWSLDGECPGTYRKVSISPMPRFLNLQG